MRGRAIRGIANLGFRPTIDDGETKRLLEVHLFDFDREIYGDDIEVEFSGFIRGEMKFENIDALQSRIGEDAKLARKILEPPLGNVSES